MMATNPRGRSLRLAAAQTMAGLAFLLLAPDSVFAQCSLCRDGAAALSFEGREALNYAIVGLAFSPYVVALGAAFALSPRLRAIVRARFGKASPVSAENSF